MHKTIPATLTELDRMPTRLLFQAEVMADAFDRIERRQRLLEANRQASEQHWRH